MVFEAILAGGFRGDIALDDISYVPGTCSVSPSIAVPIIPTKKPQPTPNPTIPGMYRDRKSDSEQKAGRRKGRQKKRVGRLAGLYFQLGIS